MKKLFLFFVTLCITILFTKCDDTEPVVTGLDQLQITTKGVINSSKDKQNIYGTNNKDEISIYHNYCKVYCRNAINSHGVMSFDIVNIHGDNNTVYGQEGLNRMFHYSGTNNKLVGSNNQDHFFLESGSAKVYTNGGNDDVIVDVDGGTFTATLNYGNDYVILNMRDNYHENRPANITVVYAPDATGSKKIVFRCFRSDKLQSIQTQRVVENNRLYINNYIKKNGKVVFRVSQLHTNLNNYKKGNYTMNFVVDNNYQ